MGQRVAQKQIATVRADNLLTLPFTHLGKSVIAVYKAVKAFFIYMREVSWAAVTPPFRVRETLEQIYVVGFKSAPIILFCVSFSASVTILEAAYHMRLAIQTAAMVPPFATLLILRELGAVLTGLLLAARVGAGMAAEVGSMQVTEQIDALKILSIDPIRYLVVPRFFASLVSGVMLSLLANAVCLFFAMVVSIYELGYTPGSFLTALHTFARFQDVVFSFIKAGVFAGVIPLISCFCGFNCKAGAEGVGHATTLSVVSNSIAIIILDFILTYIFSFFY